MQEHVAETAYITQYALTLGIIVCNTGHYNEDGYYVVRSGPHGPTSLFNKKEAWRTLEEARIDAENRKSRKIASLKKQLAKLERLEVKVREDFFK